jgi:hypothetical protein
LHSLQVNKLREQAKIIINFEKKYNDVDIDNLHNTIRDLQNKLELFKNKHIYDKKIEESFRF